MQRSATTLRKVTITLPEDLVNYADGRAERVGTNRSQVISQALAALMWAEEQELAAEGYRFYAEEAEAFAVATMPAAAELILADQSWEDKA
jgi:metal-responsive CopG/Arc/MetJ family transcriptional regulator